MVSRGDNPRELPSGRSSCWAVVSAQRLLQKYTGKTLWDDRIENLKTLGLQAAAHSPWFLVPFQAQLLSPQSVSAITSPSLPLIKTL